ncbi:MAG TPA: class I SAM-dependent methyltransferase [Candidatus Sulfotelmatobacter sp.]|jgi:SAM-dependent methyltransferase|nr:class I SAM-dependent methyltransferase [Candidatus Sulfotelmatobacter sp.]
MEPPASEPGASVPRRRFRTPLVVRNLGRVLTGRPLRRKPDPSGTALCRARLAPYCRGYGLDLGFGGDPIADHAIRMDMPSPYTAVGRESVQLGGDASDLRWFRDGVLDFIYSSHLLEDFPDTRAVLQEWLRVLKPGGRLILYCPDERRYREYCVRTGATYNTHHQQASFSLDTVRRILRDLGQDRVVHENPDVDTYSWELVLEKSA